MIYNIPGEIIRVSRTGRQYENTCIGCVNLIHNNGTANITEKHQCTLYPSMDNFVRCINYQKSITINTIQTVIHTSA